jgi:hypothetical protein
MGTMLFCKPHKNSVKRFFDLALSIPAFFLKRKGISQPGQATASEFKGTEGI